MERPTTVKKYILQDGKEFAVNFYTYLTTLENLQVSEKVDVTGIAVDPKILAKAIPLYAQIMITGGTLEGKELSKKDALDTFFAIPVKADSPANQIQIDLLQLVTGTDNEEEQKKTN